ncbi:N-acetylmuramoyl-L-alanine amidase [Streptomyces camponoticapitis]|uniref:N-acetylmuramoyl-L-alanine amidase n=1 Tax=Streptomyces camponoticapitis TaxID=1616125 RepID=A0ABQ2E6L0_9ACTN|nr:N-acetylmuramoyl-L-alanine amidase [Streptomyces camponoticapitis]GGJ98177.1 N-acetylmuramoyl-L-alanine amidase [Streptomyces camponoticapitis]
MSYDESPSPAPRRTSRTTLTIAIAALVPGAFAGWLIWQATGGSDDGGPARNTSASSPSAGSGEGLGSPGPEPRPAPSDSPSPSKPAPGDDGAPGDARPAPGEGPLAGRVVVIDPGHNPGNFKHTAEINKLVDIGTNRKECDTTGTAGNSGYTEAEFTADVSQRLRTLLRKEGATVKLTHENDRAWGPCVDERAEIGNKAKADAVISIHADGSAVGNRGFHVILPALVKSGGADTTKIVAPSRDLGERVAGNFVRTTGSAPSNYLGDDTGLDVRDDLGGLNLSTVPKVFIECGNMRDSKDIALLTSAEWRQKAAQGMADGISGFLKR